MNPRRNFIFGSLKSLLFLVTLVAILASSVLFVSKSYATGDVTLTGSSFSDSDAEDTHQASQWVVTNASGGGTTIFDSGADSSNLTTIVVPASYFTNGVTYYWKVRYQDNHSIWSDYSDEASFTYGTAATPVPTVNPTDTPTVVPSATTSVCPAGQFCGDAVVSDIYLEDSAPSCGGSLDLKYYVYSPSMHQSGGTIVKNSTSDIHDIYASTDGGINYKRIAHDIDYTQKYSWSSMPSGVAGNHYLGSDYLKVETNVLVPVDMRGSSQFRVLVHVYPAIISDSSLNWGTSFQAAADYSGKKMEYFDAADITATHDLSYCALITPTAQPSIQPTVTSTPSNPRCLLDIINPRGGEVWPRNSVQQIAWVNTSDVNFDQTNSKVSIYLLTNTGKQRKPIALMTENTGVFSYTTNPEDDASSGVLELETYNNNGEKVSFCSSSAIGFGTNKPNDPISTTNIVLVLGSLFAFAASYAVASASSIPAVSRVLSSVYSAVFAPPVWPRHKTALGSVYDAFTKRPLSGVVVRVFSEPDGKLRDARTTNENGEFGFIVPAGSYSVTASKPGYSFPSHVVTGSSDGRYASVYKGGQVEINVDQGEKTQLDINIPLDQTKANILDLSIVGATQFFQKTFSVIRLPLLILGSICAVYMGVTQGRWYDYLILAFYLALWTLEVLNLLKKRTFGVIMDDSHNPISLAVIRVVDRNNKLKGTVVSGEDGKFIINLAPGEYRFDASRAGYVPTRSDFTMISKVSDLGKININLKKLNNQLSNNAVGQDHSKL